MRIKENDTALIFELVVICYFMQGLNNTLIISNESFFLVRGLIGGEN